MTRAGLTAPQVGEAFVMQDSLPYACQKGEVCVCVCVCVVVVCFGFACLKDFVVVSFSFISVKSESQVMELVSYI